MSLGFIRHKGERNKNHIYSPTAHTQIAYLSRRLPFIPLYLLHASDSPALTFPILQILKLQYKPVSHCTSRRDGGLSFSAPRPIKLRYNCLINDRWPKPQTEDRWATCSLWKPFKGTRQKKQIGDRYNTHLGSYIFSNKLTKKPIGIIQNPIFNKKPTHWKTKEEK